MIIIQLRGGLGNQLFQYAVGRQISINSGIDFKLDANCYNAKTLRKYALSDLNIKAEQASSDEINGLLPLYYSKGLLGKVIDRYFKEFLVDCYSIAGRIVKEKEYYKFDPSILATNRRALVYGFWQNEKYFKEIRSIIQQEYQVKHGIASPYYYNVQKDMLATNSISCHVRRGDLLSDPRYFICTSEYYYKAMNYMSERVEEPVYYVFSDDLLWVMENVKFARPVVFVDSCCSDSEELLLMSACKHHIIANSTYSWWGAWLGADDSIITTPATWFTDGRRMYDFIPERWIKID